MGEVFIGREAVANGLLTRHELQRWYRSMFPGISVPKGVEPTLGDRIIGAWLWSNRQGVISGVAASALHGARWVDDDIVIELRLNCTRPPDGIIARNETLAADEVGHVRNLPATTPAVPRMTPSTRLGVGTTRCTNACDTVLHRGGQAHRQAAARRTGRAAVARVATTCGWRRNVIDAGFPKPTTQIPVLNGQGKLVRILDLGWEEFMVAAEYDGEQHRTDRAQYVKDLKVWPKLTRLGWAVVRVIKEDRDDDIISRGYQAMVARGWKP